MKKLAKFMLAVMVLFSTLIALPQEAHAEETEYDYVWSEISDGTLIPVGARILMDNKSQFFVDTYEYGLNAGYVPAELIVTEYDIDCAYYTVFTCSVGDIIVLPEYYPTANAKVKGDKQWVVNPGIEGGEICGTVFSSRNPDMPHTHEWDGGVCNICGISDNASAYTPDTETSAPIPTHYNDQIVDISSAIKNNTYNAVLDSSNLKDAIARNSEEARLGIWTWAEVTDENIPEEDINVINKNVKGATVGACLDIDLYKQIGGWERTPIYETLAPVSITVDIPAAIYDANREYAVVRVHNGVYEQITSFAKSADARITISSNLFSTYAIIYKDASAVKSPKTGENMTWFYMTIAAGACVAGLGIYRRKEN